MDKIELVARELAEERDVALATCTELAEELETLRNRVQGLVHGKVHEVVTVGPLSEAWGAAGPPPGTQLNVVEMPPREPDRLIVVYPPQWVGLELDKRQAFRLRSW